MPDAPAHAQLYKLTDVVDALRDELTLLEKQLDRDGERQRFKLDQVQVELQVVVSEEHSKAGEAGIKLGFKVPTLAEAAVDLRGTGTTSRMNGLTQTLRLSLTPVRLSEDYAKRRQQEGSGSDILLGGAE